MISFIRKIDDEIVNLASREQDPIDQIRVRILIYSLFGYLFYSGVLLTAYSYQQEYLHLVRACFIFVFAVALLIVVRYVRGSWRPISHFALCVVTLTVWSNILIYVQGINTATVQFIWIATVLSVYMHGVRWGWFYSLLNVLPVLVFTYVEYSEYNYLINDLKLFYDASPVSQSVYLFVLSGNFLMIILLNYFFFKTFRSNISHLTKTKDELKELNSRLNETLKEVNKLSNARMDFLSTMSHELRTPLNGVIGISNTLISQNPSEEQKENLAILQFSAENLMALINDILDFNKLDSDKVALEKVPFNLAAHIRKNCASVEMKAKEKMLDLRLSIAREIENKIVFSDPTRLNQVLLNLLNNAIKFTEKGYVHLTAQMVKKEEGTMTVHFSVEDSGIGIEPDKQDHIFEVFAQATASTNRNYGGTGLGLPIVKKVLSMFNSKILLVSEPGSGSRFHFDINFEYREVEASDIKQRKAEKQELSGLRVLVAEDNAINILVLRKALEQWSIVPQVAKNGQEAVEKLKADDYDLILMDLYMPVMDGCQATEKIRRLADPKKASVPIVALTANVSEDVIARVLDAGMNDYLSKPFYPDHLLEKIRKMQTPSIHL
jgi:signal transduction histidine kinase/ActR/RegA family two-component response regulator